MSTKVAIIEDEYLALELIVDYVEKLTDWQVSSTCMSAESALPILENRDIDIVFCDINLPGINGLDLSKQHMQATQVIFTTSYVEYVQQAFNNNAIDYLLKPISEDRFMLAINRFLDIQHNRLAHIIPHTSNFVHLKQGDMVQQVYLAHIQYIEAYGNICKLVFVNTFKVMLVDHNIAEMSSLLNDADFVRVHRLFIVNKNYISHIEHTLTIFNSKIPLGTLYKHNLQ
jgi:DNA-binding LytR/AlgR family response regulator